MALVLGACGGPQVPQHNGYKTEKAKPWKKPKSLQFDDKMELKTEGDLSYPDMRRARWYSIDVPGSGELSLKLEITPPGETTNEDFDLALEVLAPGYHVLAKSDLDEQDAHELNKTKVVKVKHGQYLVHVYLQGRMDTAEYVMRGSFKSTAPDEVKTNFPALVAFVPLLPMVPLADDTPKSQIKQTPISVTHVTHHDPVKPKDPTPPPVVSSSARILNMAVVAGGTQITIGRGTGSNPPATNGMHAHLNGISGGFGLANCNEKVCFALIDKATPDQIKNAGGSVSITP
jgi:hypothetical protein